MPSRCSSSPRPRLRGCGTGSTESARNDPASTRALRALADGISRRSGMPRSRAAQFASRIVSCRGFPGPWQLEPDDLVVDVLRDATRPSTVDRPVDEAPRLAAAISPRRSPGRTPARARARTAAASRSRAAGSRSWPSPGSRPVAPDGLAQSNAILATFSATARRSLPRRRGPGAVRARRRLAHGIERPASRSSRRATGRRPGRRRLPTGTSGTRSRSERSSPSRRTASSSGSRSPGSPTPQVPATGFPVRPRPYRLEDFDVLPAWEGQVRHLPEYRLWTRVEGQYDVDLRVYFGRPDPGGEMLAEAQEELDRLELPDWGPGSSSRRVGSLRAH